MPQETKQTHPYHSLAPKIPGEKLEVVFYRRLWLPPNPAGVSYSSEYFRTKESILTYVLYDTGCFLQQQRSHTKPVVLYRVASLAFHSPSVDFNLVFAAKFRNGLGSYSTIDRNHLHVSLHSSIGFAFSCTSYLRYYILRTESIDVAVHREITVDRQQLSGLF